MSSFQQYLMQQFARGADGRPGDPAGQPAPYQSAPNDGMPSTGAGGPDMTDPQVVGPGGLGRQGVPVDRYGAWPAQPRVDRFGNPI